MSALRGRRAAGAAGAPAAAGGRREEASRLPPAAPPAPLARSAECQACARGGACRSAAGGSGSVPPLRSAPLPARCASRGAAGRQAPAACTCRPFLRCPVRAELADGGRKGAAGDPRPVGARATLRDILWWPLPAAGQLRGGAHGAGRTAFGVAGRGAGRQLSAQLYPAADGRGWVFLLLANKSSSAL